MHPTQPFPPTQESIEILSVELLDQNRPTVSALQELARTLRLEFGWHYLLDLAWIIQRLGVVSGKTILDAGAGTGVLQWHLAEQGATVISVDRASRAELAMRYRRRYHAKGLRSADLSSAAQAIRHKVGEANSLPTRITTFGWELSSLVNWRRAPGKVIIYNQDLKNLADIADNSLDAIVAVSALEHNPPQELPQVINELMRTLKPGGALLATLCAARDQDWFHEPSQGWCYSEASLRRLFDLPSDAPANYARYDELLERLRRCAELSQNLAAFYFRSGDNGMPWGVWDPQYQPVGVCKVKPGR
jgi:ubiquinone/menaquinone biosynthesis C-methylase UbiE